MASVIRLVDRFEMLFIPASGFVDREARRWFGDDGAACVYHYPGGDCDSIPWPMGSEWCDRLRSCLFDARECGLLPLDCEAVELPSGELFSVSPPVEDMMESVD